MNKENGFIATSLLYSFFLVFVTLFIATVSLYLQNRVYLNTFEDSSKNSLYIDEIITQIQNNSSFSNVYINGNSNRANFCEIQETNVVCKSSEEDYNLSGCETIFSNGSTYYAKECQKL